jgi:hypothetical protein
VLFYNVSAFLAIFFKPLHFQVIQAQKFRKIADIFTSDDATVNLGVGKNMVAAIRYWLIATKVIDNDSITEFGNFLNKNDAYLEDDASLWLLHLALAKDKGDSSISSIWVFADLCGAYILKIT